MAYGRWWRRRAARRLRAGDGEPIPRFRWWQTLSRSVLSVALREPDGTVSTYTVDVRLMGDRDDGAVRARLYRDGALSLHSTVPASFPVPGGHIQVVVGTYGLQRCSYVQDDGAESRLTPHPATAEGRRARLQVTHPRLSTLVGVVSTVVVLVGICVAVPQLVETISQAPPIADALGVFESPVRLSPAANVALGIAVVAASTERAMRLRSSWLDSLAS